MEGFVAGDVVIVDYPYTDMSQTKRRPALIVYVIDGTTNIVTCQITSQSRSDSFSITLTQDDFATGGLVQPVSTIRPNYLFTFNTDLVVRTVGRIASERFEVVRTALIALWQG